MTELALSNWEGIRAKVDRCEARYGRAKLSQNVYAYAMGERGFFLRYHESIVVKVHDDGLVEFNFCDWPTKTTSAIIEGVLSRGMIYNPKDNYSASVVRFGGNLWLGGVCRPRRQNEPLSIDIGVHLNPGNYWNDVTYCHLSESQLNEWHRIDSFVDPKTWAGIINF